MGFNRFLFLLIVFIIIVNTAKAQFGRKATVSVFAGTLFTGKDKLNSEGISENLFGGYKPGIVVGGSLFYNVSKNLAAGLRARYLNVSKSEVNVNQLTIGLDGKFNFIPSDKRISPYAVAGVNFSFVGIKQTSYTQTVYPNGDYGSPNGSYANVLVNQINYYNPSVNVSFVPMLGYTIGAGVDIRLKETIGAFFQVDYSSTLAKNNNVIKENFPNNAYNLNYILLSVGLKFNLFKSKYLY